MAQLDRVERSAGVSSGYPTAPERFGELIELLREQAGERVVILVDEYDKPMLDALGAPVAVRANRDYLRGLYATIKDFDILLLFDTREFRAHWFETGTPKLLIDVLIERQVRSVDLDGMIGTEALLSTFDVDHVGIEALLFQTGYLTIKGRDSDGGRTTYRLGYPNHEVRQSLNEHLLNALLPDLSRRLALASPLQRLFATNDFPGFEVESEAP